MNRGEIAGLIYGHDLRSLDHIAPLSALLNIPLFLCDEAIESLAVKYYPDLRIQSSSPLQIAHNLLSHHSILISTLPKKLLDPLLSFDEYYLRNKCLSLYLPHGNSESGDFSSLKEENLLLVYGKQMVDAYRKVGISRSRMILMGDFRYHYFDKHRSFYEKLLPFRFPKSQQTLFYASSSEESSLEITLKDLLAALPSHFNLMVKSHPNLQGNTLYKSLIQKYHSYSNIQFLDSIPTIHPILQRADALITDHSSIAYDFLPYNRPIYFLTKERMLIHTAGTLTSSDRVYDDIQKEDLFEQARKDIYNYCFEKTSDLRNRIEEGIHSYLESEPFIL